MYTALLRVGGGGVALKNNNNSLLKRLNLQLFLYYFLNVENKNLLVSSLFFAGEEICKDHAGSKMVI